MLLVDVKPGLGLGRALRCTSTVPRSGTSPRRKLPDPRLWDPKIPFACWLYLRPQFRRLARLSSPSLCRYSLYRPSPVFTTCPVGAIRSLTVSPVTVSHAGPSQNRLCRFAAHRSTWSQHTCAGWRSDLALASRRAWIVTVSCPRRKLMTVVES